MITQTGLVEEFNLISKNNWRFAGTLYTWEKGESFNRLKVNKKSFLISGILLGFCGIIHIIHVAPKLLSEDEGDDDNSTDDSNWTGFTFVTGLVFLLFASISFDIYSQPDIIEEWLTQTLNFERCHIADNTSNGTNQSKERRVAKIGYMTCKIIRYTMFGSFPTIIGTGSVIMPNNPVNLANFQPLTLILGTVGNSAGTFIGPLAWILAKMYIFGCNYVFYYFIMRAYNMFVVSIILGCISLSEYVLYFQRKFLKERPYNITKIYREIQVLAILFNTLMAKHLIITLILGISLQIVCAMNVLGADSQTNISMKLYFAYVLVNTVLVVVGFFGFCGIVHTTSSKCSEEIQTQVVVKKVLEMMKTTGSSQANREYKRVLASLQIVKVMFGGMNYIEKLTPVMFQDFATQRLVDNLLLQNEGG